MRSEAVQQMISWALGRSESDYSAHNSAMEGRKLAVYEQNRKDVLALRRTITIEYMICLACFFLINAAYCTLLFLQSSINVEDGVGTTSAFATYATAALFHLLVTPMLLNSLGPRTAMILCKLLYIIYIAVNFYPEPYTLIPGGVIVGIGEATIWPAAMLYVVHYARRYARYASKDSEFYTTEFIGYFFVAFQLSQVAGNLISYAIFHAGKSPTDNEIGTTSIPTNISVSALPDLQAPGLEVCGVNDCQDPHITKLNLQQYTPASKTALNIMLGCLEGLVVIAVVLFLIFIEPIDKTLEVDDHTVTSDGTEGDKQRLVNHGNETPVNSVLSGESDLSRNKITEPDEQMAALTITDIKSETTCQLMLSTTKGTLRHMLNPIQLLITPLTLYSGLFSSFVFSEMTRSFASCMLGVDQIGLCMAIFAAVDAVASFCYGKVSSRFGRNVPIAVGALLNIGCYILFLLWIPSETSLWLVYVLFLVVGILDGLWNPVASELHASYFPDNKISAFNAWSFWIVIGLAIQYGSSTSLCIREKIYIQIGLLCLSIVSYGVGEMMHRRRITKQKTSDNTRKKQINSTAKDDMCL